MDLVNELVEVIFVSSAKVDECLHSLVGIGRDVGALGCFNRADDVIHEDSEIRDTVVDIRRLVHPNKRFVEDSEQITEQLQGSWL